MGGVETTPARAAIEASVSGGGALVGVALVNWGVGRLARCWKRRGRRLGRMRGEVRMEGGREGRREERTFSITTHHAPSSSQLLALKMFLLSGPSIVNIASNCFPFVDTSGVGIGPSVHPARAREMVGTARGESEFRYSWRFPEGVRTKKAVEKGSAGSRSRGEEGRTGFPRLDEPLLPLEDAFLDDDCERVVAVGVGNFFGLTERSCGGDEVVELAEVVPFGLEKREVSCWRERTGRETGGTSGATESTFAERKTERCWFVRWRWELRSRRS